LKYFWFIVQFRIIATIKKCLEKCFSKNNNFSKGPTVRCQKYIFRYSCTSNIGPISRFSFENLHTIFFRLKPTFSLTCRREILSLIRMENIIFKSIVSPSVVNWFDRVCFSDGWAGSGVCTAPLALECRLDVGGDACHRKLHHWLRSAPGQDPLVLRPSSSSATYITNCLFSLASSQSLPIS